MAAVKVRNPFVVFETQTYIQRQVANSKREIHPELKDYFLDLQDEFGIDFGSKKVLDKI
jgi:hypothetical protein